MTRNSRRFLCLAMAVLMLATLLPAALPGNSARAEDTLGITIKDEVAFRIKGSMRGDMLFRVKINTVCKVLGQSDAEGYTWYKVETVNPEFKNSPLYTGYLRGDCFRLLTPEEAAAYTGTNPSGNTPTATPDSGSSPAPSGTVGYVTAGGVNFRAAPGGQVLATLDRGTQVRVLTIPGEISTSAWYKVEYNGMEGYIMSTFLRVDNSGVTPDPSAPTADPSVPTPTPYSPTAVPVRPTATPNPDVLGYVMTIKGSVNVRASIAGTSLTMVGKYETFPYLLPPVRRGSYTWYFIQVSPSLKGYIRGDCVKVTSGPGNVTPTPGGGTPVPVITATPAPPTDTPTGFVKTTIDYVNVRQGIWGELVTVVKKAGTIFPYYGTPTERNGIKWYYIYSLDFPGTGFAYIHGGFVKETDEGGSVTTPPPATVTPTGGIITPTPTGSVITPTPTPMNDPTGYVKTTIDYVNVRDGIWGELVTVVKKAGTIFPYYGTPAVRNNIKWYYIYSRDFPGSGFAYIHGGFVKETDEGGSVITPTPATPTPTGSIVTPTPTGPVITPTVSPTVNPSTPGTATEASYVTLKNGSTGQAVQNLVAELINQGYYKYALTSKYNSSVENAVRAFQKAKGLAVDGIAGSMTQHALFNTVPIGTADHTNLEMTLYPAEKIDWNTGGIQELWPRGANVKVYDVETGLVWWAHRWSGGFHIDAEPLTAADTATICRMYGVTSSTQILESTHWQRRPCLITIGTRTFACSLYGVPHNPEGNTIRDNNFNGQLCIHFTNSKTHKGSKVDSLHAAAIDYAWLNAPNGHK